MGVQWRERIHPTRHWEGETWELLPWKRGKMFNDGVQYWGQSPGAEARTQEAPGMFKTLPKSECYLSHYLTENAVLTPAHSLFFFYSLLFCQKENNKKKYSPHKVKISSVQFSRSVVSDSLWPHGLQHARPPCPSPTLRVHSNSCPSSQWCIPTISYSVIPFSSCLQSFQASGSFPRSQLFTSGGQSIGVSTSTSVHPMNTQDWFPLGWTGWISLQSKGFSRVFSNTTVQKHQHSAFFMALTLTSIHDHWKNHSLD